MVSRSRVGPDARAGTRLTVSQGIDTKAFGRGVWRGFVILVIGALLQPIAAAVAPLAGASFLLITAAVAFAFAGFRTGDTNHPIFQGAVTAVGSYGLVLPLVFIVSLSVEPPQVVATTVIAVAAGGLAGLTGHVVRARGKRGGKI
ncbi:hypothetical protein [Amycolatopsis methanolica]|uniref:Uncharacterized protein n=1 Tax=Amycolatopsis methanolica 239 TaxID=1068978 RepID=A0A076MMJ4_AMYME|nr:hypothetical protein [Amycolatopsis methanolica]AIJ21929.1 hypothetical protein AMETH_1837 [Amycolatopsis methanolica 239]